MNDLSDEELIARCGRGDRCAMDGLVDRYHAKLLDFVCRHGLDRDTSADIAQTTLVKVFVSAHTYTPRAKFRTWLYTIAVNQIRNELRRRRTRGEHPLSDLDAGQASASPTEHASPEAALLCRAVSHTLWDAVAGLPDNHRSAIILRFRQGLKCEEIAQVMKVPPGTVRSWIHYALKKLRVALQPTDLQE